MPTLLSGFRRGRGSVCRLLIAAILSTCLLARVAFAQPSITTLGLYVDPAVLPSDALQGALEAELGMTLEPLPKPDPARPSLRVEALGNDGVRITLEAGDGRRVERDAPLLDHEAQGLETVTFLASNMLRNEAAGLLASFNVQARDTEKPPPVRLARDQEPEPRDDPLRSFDACLAPVDAPIGVDLVPGFGMSSTVEGRQKVRAFSFGLFGSYSRGVRGFSLSSLVNIQRQSMCGLQIGGISNLVFGSSQGLLISPVNLVMRAQGGATVGLLNVIRGEQRGVTVGLANLVFHDSSGASVGLVNFTIGRFRGYSGGLLNFATSHVSGVQAGVGNVSGGDLAGAQMGVGNIALGNSRGVQIGVGNIAGKSARVQVGVFNYAEKIRAPVGIVSIVRNGRTDLDLWGSGHGMILFGITHGGERVHNLYYVGARTGAAGQRFVAALGLGVRAMERGFFRLDVDAVSQYIYRNGASKPTFQQGLRVPFTFIVTPGFGLMIAPSYQFFLSEDDSERSQASGVGQTVFRKGGPRIEGFPEISFGLRFELPSASARAE